MKNQEDNRRPEEIESDIERTRTEVSSTIDAIQNKLTPSQLMDQAVAYARTSLPADFGANLSNAVRDNPVPVALVGIGIAWLIASGRNSDGQARQRRHAALYDEPSATTYSSGIETEGAHEGALHRAGSSIAGTGRDLKEKASDIGHRISDRTASVTGRAREMGHGARERVGQISERSRQGYYRTKDSFSRMVDEEPLLLGALGIAVGTILGAVLPRTRREDEMMGETRDTLVERAKGTVREQAATVKDSVQRVMEERTGDTGSMPNGHAQPQARPETNRPAASAGTDNIDSTKFGETPQSPYGPH